jgi:membrane-bound serine protease (ClpP class)
MMARVNRSLVLWLVLVAALAIMPAAVAQEIAPLDVIVVSGPLDQSMVRFVEQSIEDAAANGSQAVVIQLNSEGALSEDIEGLVDLFRQPPLPLVVWVGDAPAVAFGGAARLLIAAPLKTAAPGAEIGYLTPTVAGSEDALDVVEATSAFTMLEEIVTVQGPIPGLVDAALPSIGQVVVWMNGREVTSQQGTATLQTARAATGEDGTERMLPTAQVRFHEPGLFTRFLRLSVQPEAAFFFLVMGLTVAAFEFYAIGPGLASATGVISLLIAGYGLAVLPVRWWALVLIGLGLFVYTAEFQRRSFGPLSILATVGLVVGGLFITDAAPQIVPSAWGIVLTVLAAVFFYVIAMPVVARSRFSTGTIGRDHLIGRPGAAVTPLDPEGVVEVDGARWRARAHREAGLTPGDAVLVTAIHGLELEVDPVPESTE